MAASTAAPLDCLILDLHMPGMTGLQVLQALKTERRALPTVIITAHDTPESLERAAAGGAAAYLRKPVDGGELLAAVSAAMKP